MLLHVFLSKYPTFVSFSSRLKCHKDNRRRRNRGIRFIGVRVLQRLGIFANAAKHINLDINTCKLLYSVCQVLNSRFGGEIPILIKFKHRWDSKSSSQYKTTRDPVEQRLPSPLQQQQLEQQQQKTLLLLLLLPLLGLLLLVISMSAKAMK